MIKLSDFVMQRLRSLGAEQFFMITGGGAMHLNDSAGAAFPYFCNHHEQASAIAAEGYARATGRPAVVLVTTGPGGINALNGVLGQWTDSVPVIYLSGQVKHETTIGSCPELPLRQLGDQEVDIISVVRPLTKFAASVDDPAEIGMLLDRAWLAAVSGRPGPVWLDIPMNVQGAMIDEGALTPSSVPAAGDGWSRDKLVSQLPEVVGLLQQAKRPIFVAGRGLRLSGGRDAFLALAGSLGIPIVSTFNGFDLVPTEHPLFVGRIGTIGDRGGNFSVQNADLIIFIGTRNNIRQISYNWQCFGRAAHKVVVDIDAAELGKPTLVPDVAIHADAAYFVRLLGDALAGRDLPDWNGWLSWCSERRRRYPIPASCNCNELIDPYCFVKALTEELEEGETVVAANGTASVALFQAGIVKDGQRVIMNSGCASMGYDLPAAIGACVGTGRRVVCLAGDGSIQMNLQELATIAYHRLPLVVFLLNNNGYVSIRQTQSNFFGRLAGCDPASGVGFPDMQAVVAAYGIPVTRLSSHDGMGEAIRAALAAGRPVVCEVMLRPDHGFAPKLSSERKPDGRMVSKPLEDMFPFLDREEFRQNMLIPVMEE